MVGKHHRSSPTATHKEDNQKINHAPTSLHNGSPYVHATGITNFNTSILQIHNYSTSKTLISPSSYLKTIIKHQTSHSIQHTHKKVLLLILYTKHIMILSKLPCYLMLKICPRGNNKILLLYFLVHDNCLLFML